MKGVVLAGGRGTRLRPITKVVNKHVLPIYDEPMIYYPVNTLYQAGITEILVISNADHIGKYIELLEAEDDFEEIAFSYRVQAEPMGIAHAVSLAEEFVDDRFAVILGDNIVLQDLSEYIQSWDPSGTEARVLLTEVDQPAAYGVADVEGGHVIHIEEKPDVPESSYAVIGLYLYTTGVFEIINDLKPSDRGEFEITDVNNAYAEAGSLTHGMFEGNWIDAGTPEGLYMASTFVRDSRRD